MRDRGNQDSDASKEHLLEDLETIRTLLDREHDAEPGEALADGRGETQGEELDKTLDIELDKALDIGSDRESDGESVDQPSTGTLTPELDDELFRTLLGDAWRTSASQILETTRAEIEAYRENWAPEDTDALNNALRVRIDDTLKHWLRDLVRDNMHDLRTALLSAIDDQLKQEISRFLAQTRDDSSAQEADE